MSKEGMDSELGFSPRQVQYQSVNLKARSKLNSVIKKLKVQKMPNFFILNGSRTRKTQQGDQQSGSLSS